MALFGMRLDKRQFSADFGVTIDQGLAVEIAFMRAAGAFSIDNAEELVLSAKGRYLLVAMMREFFVGVNNLRDQAREAIATPERELLFGDGVGGGACPADSSATALSDATADTETAESSPIPR
jgi:hypothetical protein